MSIEKITSKIIEDAEMQARSIAEDAQKQADEIVSRAQQEADQKVKDAEQRGKEDKLKVISRRQSVADIDSRKLLLQTKQEKLNACFSKAAEEAADLEPGEYVAFLTGIAAETGLKKAEVILNARDREKVGEALMKALKKEIPGSAFTLSEETRPFSGGLMLRDGKVYINGTIESFAKEAREELAEKAAEILFRVQ
ncbi:MAG: V-type ATP synthase subunit E [Eubacterium sp.]|jgi:V/A-type H+-transporting ATPase subunit E